MGDPAGITLMVAIGGFCIVLTIIYAAYAGTRDGKAFHEKCRKRNYNS